MGKHDVATNTVGCQAMSTTITNLDLSLSRQNGRDAFTELIRLREVSAITATSDSTVLRWVKNGTFPQPIKINGCTRWKRSEVDDFLSNALSRRATK